MGRFGFGVELAYRLLMPLMIGRFIEFPYFLIYIPQGRKGVFVVLRWLAFSPLVFNWGRYTGWSTLGMSGPEGILGVWITRAVDLEEVRYSTGQLRHCTVVAVHRQLECITGLSFALAVVWTLVMSSSRGDLRPATTCQSEYRLSGSR